MKLIADIIIFLLAVGVFYLWGWVRLEWLMRKA